MRPRALVTGDSRRWASPRPIPEHAKPGTPARLYSATGLTRIRTSSASIPARATGASKNTSGSFRHSPHSRTHARPRA
jgi:hypothetical protein